MSDMTPQAHEGAPFAPEVTIAEEQHEYKALVGAVHDNGNVIVTRWRLDDDDRARIADGEDIYLGHLTFNGPFQPISVQVGPGGWRAHTEGEETR